MGLTLEGEISSRKISLSREVQLLQRELELLQEEIRRNVVFETGNNRVGFEAKRTLDKVVDAMNRYKRPVVEVGGHTDSDGDAEANYELSLRRASAVREYLELAGIDGLRLRALGYGESQPLFSNDTKIGKEQNRRVDFKARESF